MSNNKDFVWTDENVKEFYNSLPENFNKGLSFDYVLEQFKKSKEKIEEPIKVVDFVTPEFVFGVKLPESIQYLFTTNKPIPNHYYPYIKGELNRMVEAVNKAKENQYIPDWYTEQEVYDWLIRQNYSEIIAKELSSQWWQGVTGAFKKGWEKAKNEGKDTDEPYIYYNPNEQTKKDTQVEKGEDNKEWMVLVFGAHKNPTVFWEWDNEKKEYINNYGSGFSFDSLMYPREAGHYSVQTGEMYIKSVLRKSDGETFSIGDNVKVEKEDEPTNWGGKITEFWITGNGDMHICYNGHHYDIQYFKKVDENKKLYTKDEVLTKESEAFYAGKAYKHNTFSDYLDRKKEK